MVIDAQKEFCSPWRLMGRRGTWETRRTCIKIANQIPRFRHYGATIYNIYFDHNPMASAASIDFYKYKPDFNHDWFVRKSGDSAFRGTDGKLEAHLHDQNIDTLYICGFNTTACVRSTVLDALSCDFNVRIFQDLTANDRFAEGDPTEHLKRLDDLGARSVTSDQRLQDFEENLIQTTGQKRSNSPKPRLQIKSILRPLNITKP